MSDHPCRRGARRHVIFHHNRPLAPATEGGTSGRGRSAGPAGRAPAPWSRPGAWPWWASWRGAALWRRCASTSPTWVPVGPGALGLEVGRALPSPVHDQTGAPAGGPGRPRRACIGLDAHQGGRIGGRRVIAVEDETMRAARGEGPTCRRPRSRAGGVVVGGRRVSDESNEIPALRDLLEPLELDGALAGADATAHPGGWGRVDHLPRRPLPADGQGQPARSAPAAQEAALEGHPGHLHPRRLPRAAGTAHRQSRPGPRPGRLPRRGPSGPDPAHPHRQGQEAGRGGLPGSARFP